MPISPALLPLYPGGSIRSKAWRELRDELLDAAGWCCQTCFVEHCRRIWRFDNGTFMTGTGAVFCDRTGRFLRLSSPAFEVGRPVIVYLAVCHKDHDPSNCDRNNYLVLCQQCHLRHDAAHHRQSMRARLAIRDLFHEETGGFE